MMNHRTHFTTFTGFRIRGHFFLDIKCTQNLKDETKHLVATISNLEDGRQLANGTGSSKAEAIGYAVLALNESRQNDQLDPTLLPRPPYTLTPDRPDEPKFDDPNLQPETLRRETTP